MDTCSQHSTFLYIKQRYFLGASLQENVTQSRTSTRPVVHNSTTGVSTTHHSTRELSDTPECGCCWLTTYRQSLSHRCCRHWVSDAGHDTVLFIIAVGNKSRHLPTARANSLRSPVLGNSLLYCWYSRQCHTAPHIHIFSCIHHTIGY